MKIMIIGHARHGKDTVAHMLCAIFGLDFTTSSQFCAEKVVRPYMAGLGIYYKDGGDCYKDRANNRSVWFKAIAAYNTPDATKLTRAILSNHDVYCGIRNKDELLAVQNFPWNDFKNIKYIWVDALMRIEPEPETSMTITKDMCNYVIDNNFDLDHLWFEVRELAVALKRA